VKAAFLASPDGRVFVSAEDRRARTQLEWWSIILGRHESVTVVREGHAPPAGAMIVIRGAACAGCAPVLQRDGYGAYRLPG